METNNFLAEYLINKNRLLPEMKEMIKNPSFRASLYKELNTSFDRKYHSLLCELLKEEMIYRANEDEDDGGEYFEGIYWCSLFLYKIGKVEDVNILWKAKNIDFDTFCGFDVQFLVGAGVDKTIEYLQSKTDEDSKKALDCILKCKNADDFSYLDKWYEFREIYFK